jgi:phosphoglycerate dehydrogenase-like enzyme
LRGREVLVIGAGEAVKDLVPMLATLHMAVTVATRSPGQASRAFPEARAVIALDELTAALPSADFVVLAIPLTPTTRGLIGKEQLDAMKASAVLVNMARSLVVDEAALYGALVNHGIAAAGLDVWTRRPAGISERLAPSPHDFASLDNVLLTPHFAGWTHESQAARWRNIAENVDRLATGQPLLSVVAVGEHEH